ncbi:hypothetical protein, conserved [Eimeria maxima]|uniref:Uncharacterized protein n=1 Tax=Eimeria maxima TaxID=5804 RepID=U6M1K6_EIMMA|nr:hypothetical protein, conserved [Eimeria maxima]CDJ58092.1 hypothetical protein, conserved [Eimeria maxima]
METNSFLAMRPGPFRSCSGDRESAVDSVDSPIVRWEMLPAHIWNRSRMINRNGQSSCQTEPLRGIRAHATMRSHIPVSPRNNADAAPPATAESTRTTAAEVGVALRESNQGMENGILESGGATPDFPSSEVIGSELEGDGSDSITSSCDGTEADFESIEGGEVNCFSPFQEGGDWVLEGASPRTGNCDGAACIRCAGASVEAELFFGADVIDLGANQGICCSSDSESDDSRDSACSTQSEGDAVEGATKAEAETKEPEGGAEDRGTTVESEEHKQQLQGAVDDMWHPVCPVHGLDGIGAFRLKVDLESSDADGWTDVGGGQFPSGETEACTCLNEPFWQGGQQLQQPSQLQAKSTEQHTKSKTDDALTGDTGLVLPDRGILPTGSAGPTASREEIVEAQPVSSNSCSSSNSYGNRSYSVSVTPEASEGSLSPANTQGKADIPVGGRLQDIMASLEAQQWRYTRPHALAATAALRSASLEAAVDNTSGQRRYYWENTKTKGQLRGSLG